MKVLELFSGTKSIGKICDEYGWESISVDEKHSIPPDFIKCLLI